MDATSRQEIVAIHTEGGRQNAAVAAARSEVPPVPTRAPSGAKPKKLVMKNKDAAAAPLRRRRLQLLVDMHMPTRARAERRGFLKQGLLRLRGMLGFCIRACKTVLGASNYDLYGRPSPSEAPLLDECELRTRRMSDIRVSLGTIGQLGQCCSRDCCRAYTTPAARAELRAAVEAARNSSELNDAVVAAMWCRGLGRTNSLCNEYFRRVAGIAPGRCSRLRALSIAHDGVLAAAMDAHGNVGRAPANKTSVDCVAKLERAIEKYTRPGPTRGCVMRRVSSVEPCCASS